MKKPFIVISIIALGILAITGYFHWQHSLESSVIFPAQKTREWLNVFQGKDAFTPTEEDVTLAEALLRPNFPGMDDYYRQYFGVINQAEEKEIYMMAFRKSMENEIPDWRKEILAVMDGGGAFYDGAVNLDRKMLLYVGPHGEA